MRTAYAADRPTRRFNGSSVARARESRVAEPLIDPPSADHCCGSSAKSYSWIPARVGREVGDVHGMVVGGVITGRLVGRVAGGSTGFEVGFDVGGSGRVAGSPCLGGGVGGVGGVCGRSDPVGVGAASVSVTQASNAAAEAPAMIAGIRIRFVPFEMCVDADDDGAHEPDWPDTPSIGERARRSV